MKPLAFVMTLALGAAMITSCDKDDNKNTGSGNNNTTNPPGAGTGRAVIYSGSDSLVVEGPCGSQNNLGYSLITIEDADSSTHTFNIALSTIDLPMNTTIYTLSDTHETSTEALMEFFVVQGNSFIDWTSDSNSGAVTLTVNGNHVTCDFNHIPLQPSIVYNDAPWDQVGYVSGTMSFYN